MKRVYALVVVSGMILLSGCSDVSNPSEKKSAFDWCAEDLKIAVAVKTEVAALSSAGTVTSSSSEVPAVLDCATVVTKEEYTLTYKSECVAPVAGGAAAGKCYKSE